MSNIQQIEAIFVLCNMRNMLMLYTCSEVVVRCAAYLFVATVLESCTCQEDTYHVISNYFDMLVKQESHNIVSMSEQH